MVKSNNSTTNVESPIDKIKTITTNPTLPNDNINNSIAEQILRLLSKIEIIEMNNKEFQKEIKIIKKKENRLLNRFSWTLLIANFGLGGLLLLIGFLFFDLFKPFVMEFQKQNGFTLWVIGGFGTLIFTGITCLIWRVEKLLLFIKDRDTKDKFNLE